MAGILGGGRRARVESWRTLVSLLAFQRAARCLAAFIPAPRLSAVPYRAACPLMCLIACLLSFVVAWHAAAAVLYFYPVAGTQLPQHGHIVQKRNTRRYSQECIPPPCCISIVSLVHCGCVTYLQLINIMKAVSQVEIL